MPAPKYHLIFDSRQVPSEEQQALKNGLQTHLGLDVVTLARLFSGRPVVIRRNLSKAKAGHFAERLEAIGAPCRVEGQPPADATSRMSDSLVVCPKCQQSQSPVAECKRCGLIFSKYRPGDPEPPITQKDPAENTEPPEQEVEAASMSEPPRGKIARFRAALFTLMARLNLPFRRSNPKGPHAAPPYLQVVLNQGLKIALTAVIALVLLIGGMWFARGLWMLYTATQVGERYLADFPRKAQAIVMVLSQHTLILPLTVILVTLSVCAVAAAASQFLHLGRYFYYNRPWWWHLLLWYLPLSIADGMVLHHLGLAPSAKLGSALSFIPTLCLAPAAFDSGQALICELGDIMARLRAWIHHPMVLLRNHIASHLNR